jgi:hypothetical protein
MPVPPAISQSHNPGGLDGRHDGSMRDGPLRRALARRKGTAGAMESRELATAMRKTSSLTRCETW